MTRGLGLSIGTARAVAVNISEDGTSTVSRRSTLTFGAQSTVRLGDDPGGAGVVAEFAHRPGEVFVAGGGRGYTGQDLIAAAAYCLVAEVNPPEDVPIVLTYPAVHSRSAVDALRAALDRAGLGRVGLVAEPVAALAYVEFERGPLGDGLALVGDIDTGNLDLTLVAFGSASGSDPIVGRPLRFGDRHAKTPVTDHPTRTLEELVADCLRMAAVACDDLDVVVVSGESAADPTVMQSLSQLGRPIVSGPEPGSIAARGAAVLAAASSMDAVPEATSPKPSLRRAAVASIAAAVLLAMPLSTRGPAPDPVVTAATRGAPGLDVRLIQQAERPHIPSGRALGDSPASPAAPMPTEYALATLASVIVHTPVALVPTVLAAPADADADAQSDLDSTTAASATPSVSQISAFSIEPRPAPRPESPPVTPEPTTEVPTPATTTPLETPEPTPTDRVEPGVETSEPSNP
ncbi:hypothetical protein [Rhodococcus tibetensis]|uniref:Hsp70 protein n=1 Tax=Rhodococcus tibetensis TaxID=2965064 RepID=A0ABT1QKB9_9NOCA|nr:hypothetical protein [Rhodococcus sp. FXJ9.536]MCQ4122647.1 hypothetical protein [Rhodococcus sp. FXJ9.536]